MLDDMIRQWQGSRRAAWLGLVSSVVLAIGLDGAAAGCATDSGPQPTTPPASAAPAAPVAHEPDAAAKSNTAAESDAASAPEAGPSPAPATQDVPNAQPAAPPPLRRERTPPPPIQMGWAVIDERAESAQRAWVEGEVVVGDRFVIQTQNVRRFTLDLTRVRLDWSKRIVLRMDGFNSELTRKRWPKLHFIRTPSGAWDAVAD